MQNYHQPTGRMGGAVNGMTTDPKPKMSELVKVRADLLGKIKDLLYKEHPPQLDGSHQRKREECLEIYFGIPDWETITNLQTETLRAGWGRMSFNLES